MRWKQQTIEHEAGAALPGYQDVAVRHFDAPEAIDTRFYEVRAKSILNHVPPASQMPFRWTVNPYRGCAHACVYCAWGETPILMADGRHRRLSDVRVGDPLYGTIQIGKYRKYAVTTVLARQISVKPAFRVTLADGTELITSGDHRFLSDGGWKYVQNNVVGPDRPHLTQQNRLVGTGQFAPLREETGDYRRGYLCGMIRGDRHLKYYWYEGEHGVRRRAGGFRLALADTEALSRASSFLFSEGVGTSLRALGVEGGNHRGMQSISTPQPASFDQIEELIAWPTSPSVEWLRGFLAGMFDAEGSRRGSALRISTADPELLRWTDSAARRLSFDSVVDPASSIGVSTVRIRGGLAEHLRFFHLTDPAITRKRSIEGQLVRSFTDLRVVAIEPVGRAMPLYDITTGTGDFIANGVVSHNCFARPTHEYLDLGAGRDFEREIVVKVNAPERLRAELAKPSWQREHVALGTNTDPYQWVEGRYELMRGIWEALRDARNPCSVLTKSPLLLRDLDLMRELNAITEFSAALSIPTLDQKAWRATEPRTPNPRARLEAITDLKQAGIRTGVLVAPLMPGINDRPEQVREVVRLATEAGADYITGIALHLRRGVREVFMEWLSEQRPELVPRYEELYRQRAYMSVAERHRLTALIDGPLGAPSERTSRMLRGEPLDPQMTGHSASKQRSGEFSRERGGNRASTAGTPIGRAAPPEPAQTRLF